MALRNFALYCVTFACTIGTFDARADQSARSASICAATLIGREPDLEPWIADMIDDFTLRESPGPKPTSFDDIPFRARLKNEAFVKSLRVNLYLHARRNRGVPANARDPSAGLRHVLHRARSSPITWALRGTLFNSVSGLIEDTGNSSVIADTIREMRRFHAEFKTDITTYESIYGVEHLTPEVLARGTINSQTMKLFALVDGGRELKSRDAANAIALLHPLTDEALDKGLLSADTIRKLSAFVEDHRVPATDTEFERILFGLLSYIDRDFPVAEHPWLHSMIRRLHHAQLRSLSQKGELGEAELLHLTFEKGGLSTAIAGYLALGGLTRGQYEFFFKAGSVFQIMDDLLDIDIDLAEGGRTVWTSAIVRGQSLRPTLDRFLALEARFEDQLDALTRDFYPGAKFAEIYQFAFKLTIMRGLARNTAHFGRADLASIRRAFPVTLSTLNGFFRFSARETNLVPKDVSEIIRASEIY